MKVYICIPIKPTEECVEKVAEAIRVVEKNGHTASYPKFIMDRECGYVESFGRSITELLKCRGIYLADGWRENKRCSCELAVARAHGMRIFHSKEALDKMRTFTLE